jgi:hypothetical protein
MAGMGHNSLWYLSVSAFPNRQFTKGFLFGLALFLRKALQILGGAVKDKMMNVRPSGAVGSCHRNNLAVTIKCNLIPDMFHHPVTFFGPS